jgi:pantothenate kinase
LSDNLKKILKDNHDINAAVVSMDGYHYYKHQLDKFEDPKEAHARRGAAFTFNADRFVKDVKRA